MARVVEQLEGLAEIGQPLHLAMGVFDGVHIGHQKVVRAAVDAAREDGGLAGVLTFDPHPIRVLAPHVAPRRILASLNHKRELLADLGVGLLVVIPFTREFAGMEASGFLDALSGNARDLRSLSMGEDWKFGKGRRGDTALLRDFGERNGIQISTVPAVMLDGERVSSTRIRQAIRDGNLDAAAAMLGRPYTVLGTVVEGRKLGRELGFPTANLRVHNEQLPCDGVWAVRCELDDGTLRCGAGNLGLRPTVEGADPRRMLEIHLLDFDGDIYGREMEVTFLQMVREEKKFESLDALRAQIAEDVTSCRKLCTS